MKKIFLPLLLTLYMMSCTSNFEEINTNPNLIDKISPGALINEIVYNMCSNNATNFYNINAELMQVQLQYPKYYGGVQRFEILSTTGNSTWNASYRWAKNVKEMMEIAESENASNYIAIALTLKAWIYSNLTDNFGNVPFSEASRAEEGILQAKYDSQESIYEELLSDLEKANSLYDHSVSMTGTDILFNKDLQAWQRFTNSLRLRLLLRVSGVRTSAYQEMKTIFSDPNTYPIISDQAESVIFNVTGVTPNLSPWSRALDFSNQHSVSKFFIDILNDLDDPRRPIFVTPAHDRDNNEIGYEGIPSGYDNEVFEYSPSYMNNQQVIPPMILPILTYAEIAFIKAELAQKGQLSGNAEDYYKEAVSAAIQTWTGKMVDNSYFDKPLAAYNGTMERIMLHKYLALYFTDFQQWSEYKRTGYPRLPVTTSMLNDQLIPSRLLYPADQQISNPANYQEGAQSMGGDNINSKVWWNVK